MIVPHPFNSLAAIVRAGGYLVMVYTVACAFWCAHRLRRVIAT